MIQKTEVEGSSVEKANAAFERAAVDVVERARATGTSVIIWRAGQIVRLTADEAEEHLRQHWKSGTSPPCKGTDEIH